VAAEVLYHSGEKLSEKKPIKTQKIKAWLSFGTTVILILILLPTCGKKCPFFDLNTYVLLIKFAQRSMSEYKT
jgi:hypothetical protein